MEILLELEVMLEGMSCALHAAEQCRNSEQALTGHQRETRSGVWMKLQRPVSDGLWWK
jgi:hypothetical protein